MKPKQLIEIAQKAASDSFTKGDLDSKKAEKFIAQFKKLSLSEAQFILKEYAKALKRALDQITLTVESTSPLSKEQMKKIESLMGKHFNIAQSENQINPSLLGGFRFKIGDMVVDSSLKQKIQSIGEVVRG